MAYAEQITAKDLLDSLKNKISEMSGDQKVILQSFFEEIGSAYPLDFIVALMDGIDESDESIEYLQRLHQAADDLVSGNSQ